MLDGFEASYAMKYFADVWRSPDGINWERLPNTDFGIRSGHAAVVDESSGRIFIQGGRHGTHIQDSLNASHPNPEYFHLWSSVDGVNWVSENDTTFDGRYLPRTEHHLAMMDGDIYGFPGATSSNVHFHFAKSEHYTFWRRDPGQSWSVDSEGSDFSARYGYSMVNHDGKVWILGGDTGNNGLENDVWMGEIK
jgi:hypothetical protein